MLKRKTGSKIDFISPQYCFLNLDKTEALYIADDFENVSTNVIHGIVCNINGAMGCLGVDVGHNQALYNTLN